MLTLMRRGRHKPARAAAAAGPPADEQSRGGGAESARGPDASGAERPRLVAVPDAPPGAEPGEVPGEWSFGALLDPWGDLLLAFADRDAVLIFTPHRSGRADREAIAAAWRQVRSRRPTAAPERVRVAAPEFVDLLREFFGAGVEVVVAPTPEFDLLRVSIDAEVEEELPRRGSAPLLRGVPPSYFHGAAIPSELIRRFFVAVAEFRAAAPWTDLRASDVLELSIPALGVADARVVVITDEGLGGLVIFADERASQDSLALGLRPVDATMVMVYRRGQLPLELRRELRRLPFVRPTGPIPALVATERDGASRPIGPREYRIATATLGAITRAVTDRATPLSFPRVEVVDTLQGPVEVRLARALVRERGAHSGSQGPSQ